MNSTKFVILPMYGKGGKVFPKSGLNHWNANGSKRSRKFNEIYVNVPSIVHKKFPHFFPHQDAHFDLVFPDGRAVMASLCQSGGKALMTKPNSELGKLILRDILDVDEGEIVTNSTLKEKGVDSVKIESTSGFSYKLSFPQFGAYEEFLRAIN